MTNDSSGGTRSGPGDEAVRKATGRDWAGWLEALDAAGAREMDHKQIVARVGEIESEASGWWRQSVAVGYEKARGMRKDHEKPGGFEISRTKTVDVPLAAAYEAWSDAEVRSRWLDASVRIRKETPGRSMRVDWPEGGQILDVRFTEKESAKTQVSVQHTKLPDAEAAGRMKGRWAAALTRMKELLES